MRNITDSSKIMKQLEFLMGASKIGVDIIDSKFNIRYIDPAWKKVYGDPAGRKCYRYFMGRGAPCPGCGVVKALRTKKIAVTEEALVKEGNRPIQVTTIPFRDDNGEWLVAETNVDITRIRQAEEALRSSEKRYRELFEKSNDAIFVADMRTRRLIDCNVRAETMFGYPRRKLLSLRIDDLHPKYAVAGTVRYFKEIAAGKRVFAEIEMLTARKKIINVSISATKMAMDGKPCAMGIFRDVTAHRMADARVREESSFRSSVINSAAEGIAVCHEIPEYPYVNFTVWNKRMTEITGYSMEYINRRGWYQTVYPDPAYREKARLRMERMRKGDNLRKEEWTITRSNGVRRVLQISTGVIKSAEGNVHVVALMDDITDRKMAAEVLERDRKELERLVEARSADLLRVQRELHKAKRLSDIGLLAATVAHELRSPFAAILTAAYNIKTKSGDPRLYSHLANIEKKVLEADQIIKNLLYYSSIKVPRRETVAVCGLIEECIELSRLLFREYRVSVRRVCKCPKDVTVEADPVQLKEVFNNILNNAYEAFDRKKGAIEIKASIDDGILKVRVKDNGHGIDPKSIKKVFEPFYSTKANGIGLGLSLCYQIITLHDGAMSIESRAGKGTSVMISLPLSKNRKKTEIAVGRA